MMGEVMQNHIAQTAAPAGNHKVLITKLLPKKEVKRLKANGFSVKELAFIKKEYRQFDYPLAGNINAIFTSVQAVKSLKYNDFDFGKINRAFCVGDKTANALMRQGVEVAIKAGYAGELAKQIVAKHSSKEFVAFVGNLRRDELFNVLAAHHIKVQEVIVYDTIILKRLLGEQFNRVAFFSPSGVHGYVEGGNNTHATAYCLGEVTAAEAKKYFNRVHIAPEPRLESLIDYLIKDIKNHA